MSASVLNAIPSTSFGSTRYIPIQTGSVFSCTRCRCTVHKSAFSLVSSEFLCDTCKGIKEQSELIGTKMCKLCCRYSPLTKFLSVNEMGAIIEEDICSVCKNQIVSGYVNQAFFGGIRSSSYVTEINKIKANNERINKRDSLYPKIIKTEIHQLPVSVTTPDIAPKINSITAAAINTNAIVKKYPSAPSLKSSNSSTPSSTSSSTRTTPYKQSNAQKNCKDLVISYSELQLIVTEDIFNCLYDDKATELVIYSSSTRDIEELYSDDVERREKIIDELVSFVKSTIEKVHCKTCKKAVPKADCFLHHGSFLCKDCSMRVAANHLMDWTNYSTVLIKCGRCKHFAPYSKFLKMNGVGDIKRQNTCSFCCLKKWREYYLGSKVW